MSEVRFWDLLVEEVLKHEKGHHGGRPQESKASQSNLFSKPQEDRLLTWLTAHTSARPITQDPKAARNTYRSTQKIYSRRAPGSGTTGFNAKDGTSDPQSANVHTGAPAEAVERQAGTERETTTGPKDEEVPRPMGSLEMLCLMRLKKWGASSLCESMSARELKQAYRALAKRYHPDRNPEGGVPFHEIRECYEILNAWINKPA